MATIELPNGWKPRRYQFPLWDALQNKRKDRAIEIAHRRWGKDDVILHHTAIEAHRRVATYWHCLPEYEQARKAIWNAVNPHTGKRRIDEAFPHELRETKDEQQMFIRFKNGSTWQVVGSDRYNSLVGAGVAGVAFSEWALCNPSAWGYIRPMMEENNGWAAFITTPRGRNHAKAMFDMAKDNPRWFAEISTVHDTGALSPAQLEESLKEYIALYGEDLGTAQFEQEYECNFNAAILGAFYAKEMAAVRREGRIDEIEAVEGLPVHRAWDIGVSDDTSIWWFQVVGAQVFILDCYSKPGEADIEVFAGMVHRKNVEMGWISGKDYVPHDAKQKVWGMKKGRLETMTEFGLSPEVVPSLSKLDGINAVRRTLPLCVFHPRCEDVGIPALEQYRREWDDERKTFRANAIHDWTSHAADAFRYLAVAWRPMIRSLPEKKARPAPRGSVYLPGAPEPSRSNRIRI